MQLEILEEISIGPERDQKLACVDKFCYLGDIIEAGGGAGEASRARVRCAWAKFRELAPMKVKGKVYRACVQRVLVYGSETWPVKAENMQRLEKTERMKVRWMCGTSLNRRISSNDLNKRLNVEAVADVVRQGRLRWFGAVVAQLTKALDLYSVKVIERSRAQFPLGSTLL